MASLQPIAGTSKRFESSENQCTLLQLPQHIIQHSLSFLAYNEISEARRVCQYFNRCCQDLLTQGFNKVDKFHNQVQREVKSKLPRRESERRNHELSRHVDILSAVETRLSLLSMTYSKYIDHGLCCFIPGKVLDELFCLLRKLQVKDSQPPRAYEFLQELRDISSMAMEHFEEHIIPGLKQHLPSGSLPLDPFSPEQSSSSPVVNFSTSTMRMPPVRQELMRLQHQVRVQSGSLQTHKKELAKYKSKMVEQRKINLEHEKKMQEQGRKIQEQNRIIADQNTQIDMLKTSINNFNNRMTAIYTLVQSDRDISTDITDGNKNIDAENAGQSGNSEKCSKRLKRSKLEESEMTAIKTRQKRKTEPDVGAEENGRGKTKPLKRKKY